jgi:Do/DeqQ family serine protease
MKGKNLLGGLLIAVAGAAITLLIYTKFVQKPVTVVERDSSTAVLADGKPFLTSFQLGEGQIDFTYAAEQTVHAVVHVRTKSMVKQPDNPFMEWWFGDRYSNQPRERQGFGSGVIISEDGYIVTNNHVIEDAENIEVKLNDNRILSAEVIGRDPTTDIALLKVNVNNLQYLRWGDSEKLKVGEWVLAVGNPFTLGTTVTAGIVSAKGRNLDILEGEYRIESFIQTDAALNSGNSGGALVDTKGLLVGITSAIYSPSGAYAGNSFAIPVSIVKKVVDDLKEYGEVQRAIIGVLITDMTSEEAKKLNMKEVKGALVSKVYDGGAAAEANLKENDVILKIAEVPVNTSAELQEQVAKYRPGDKISITYLRAGKEFTVPVILKNIAGNTNVVTRGMTGMEVFGARLEGLSSKEKRSYKLENGVRIVELGEGLFKDIGLRSGTIITTINGKKVNNSADVRSAIGGGESSLKTIEGYTPDGRFFSYRFGN